jgi:ribosome modulation factor
LQGYCFHDGDLEEGGHKARLSPGSGGEWMIAQVYYEAYWRALDGEAQEANPYQEADEAEHWRSWKDGWEDAQLEGAVSDR